MTYVNNKIGEVAQMPRPRKCRRVCCLPDCNRFGPLDCAADVVQSIKMAVDEYETIRLIDLEGLTQEMCSVQMNVARTTVQLIYNDARKKLADALVHGKVLYIEGGEYQLCKDSIKPCGRGCCHRQKDESTVTESAVTGTPGQLLPDDLSESFQASLIE
jgi:predicted DNA-binding protein (UPF0251 family)